MGRNTDVSDKSRNEEHNTLLNKNKSETNNLDESSFIWRDGDITATELMKLGKFLHVVLRNAKIPKCNSTTFFLPQVSNSTNNINIKFKIVENLSFCQSSNSTDFQHLQSYPHTKHYRLSLHGEEKCKKKIQQAYFKKHPEHISVCVSEIPGIVQNSKTIVHFHKCNQPTFLILRKRHACSLQCFVQNMSTEHSFDMICKYLDYIWAKRSAYLCPGSLTASSNPSLMP